MRWRFDDIVTFVRVAEVGSITAAANRMNLSKSVISKRISDLEAALEVELFRRSTRAMRLTGDGQAFYEKIVPLLNEIDETADSLSGQRLTSLRGQLRVTTPTSFGIMYLGPVVAAFARRHPELELAIDYEDSHVNLVSGGYDLGIRIGNFRDSSLKARKLGECKRVVCCSPEYAERNGLPKSVGELVDHICIDYAHVHASRFWRFDCDVKGGRAISLAMRSRIVLNNGHAIRDMAIAGLGIASLPMFLAAKPLSEGALIPILPTATQPPYAIAAIYPTTRHVAPKVRAFIDHLVEFFAPPLPWERDFQLPKSAPKR